MVPDLPDQQRVMCPAMLLALVGVGGLRLAIEQREGMSYGRREGL